MGDVTVGSGDLAYDFLCVKPGDLVVIEEDSLVVGEGKADWWLGQVINVIGGARDPDQNSLFQAVDVDTGFIKTINADLVKGILRPKDLG